MAFGNIGKVIAGQALEATKKNVMDAITNPDPKTPEKPAAPPVETVGGTILGQLQAMQRPLGEDQEMMVTAQAAGETLRISEILVPNLHVFVLVGTDSEQNLTRIIVPADSVCLVCKIRKVAPEAKPVRVNILSPRPKP